MSEELNRLKRKFPVGSVWRNDNGTVRTVTAVEPPVPPDHPGLVGHVRWSERDVVDPKFVCSFFSDWPDGYFGTHVGSVEPLTSEGSTLERRADGGEVCKVEVDADELERLSSEEQRLRGRVDELLANNTKVVMERQELREKLKKAVMAHAVEKAEALTRGLFGVRADGYKVSAQLENELELARSMEDAAASNGGRAHNEAPNAKEALDACGKLLGLNPVAPWVVLSTLKFRLEVEARNQKATEALRRGADRLVEMCSCPGEAGDMGANPFQVIEACIKRATHEARAAELELAGLRTPRVLSQRGMWDLPAAEGRGFNKAIERIGRLADMKVDWSVNTASPEQVVAHLRSWAIEQRDQIDAARGHSTPPGAEAERIVEGVVESTTEVVKWKPVRNDARCPRRATEDAVGFDGYAAKYTVLKNGDLPVRVPLGFAVELPPHLELQVRPRSGRTMDGVHVAFGTIDPDYRGEVSATMWYQAPDGSKEVAICVYDRVCQLAVAHRIVDVKWQQTEELSETKRGQGGYGSTGR